MDRVLLRDQGVTNLRVIPAAGGAPVELTHGATFVLHPSWTPDGRSIVYSTFDNVTNVWELPVSDGRAAGPPAESPWAEARTWMPR